MNGLTEDEETILKICARMHISENKNVRLQSIQKRYKRYSKVSPEPVIKELIKKGLMAKYRKENYCMTQTGRILARRLYEEELSRLGFQVLLIL